MSSTRVSRGVNVPRNSGLAEADRTEEISMKSYIATTGVIFALLALSHVARVFGEGTHVMREPIFVATTIASVGLCIWAILLLMKRGPRDC
jgi:hypothetical protein